MNETSSGTTPIRVSERAAEQKPVELEVDSWPDLNIPKWVKWGFNPHEVYRTLRYNFIFQQVRPTLEMATGKDGYYSLRGKWFRINDMIESRMEKMLWLPYVFSLLFFMGLLNAFLSNQGPLAAGFFFLMYFSLEGFIPVSMHLLTNGGAIKHVRIPWRDITRAVLVSEQGVILIGWKDEGEAERAVAIRFNGAKAEKLFDELKTGLPETASAARFDNVMLAKPPGNAK